MENPVSEFNLLESLIVKQLEKYKQAIIDNKELEDVKVIYTCIKELRKQLMEFETTYMNKVQTQTN